MRILKAAVAALAGSILSAAPAHACFWVPPDLPVFWSHPPLYTFEDEVALRVRLKAHSQHIESDGTVPEFTIECGTHRSGLVFDVLEVLHGDFDEKEIAIISNDHYFFDEPRVGETRIVVGKVRLATHVGERYVTNSPELEDRGVESAEYFELLTHNTVGPPSQIAALESRAPIELRVLFLFERPLNWIFVGAGLAVGGILVAVGRVLVGRRKRART